MIRATTVLWALAIILVGYAMFQVKYEVMQQESELAHLDRQIALDRETIRVLNAEWSFLNQPARLEALAKRYLALVPIGTAQLGRLDDIPVRGSEAAVASGSSTPAGGTAIPAAARSPKARSARTKAGVEP